MEKYNKISSKMYKQLVQQTAQQKVQQNVQQKVQQKVHNNYVALLIKQLVFAKLVNFSTNSLNTQLRM